MSSNDDLKRELEATRQRLNELEEKSNLNKQEEHTNSSGGCGGCLSGFVGIIIIILFIGSCSTDGGSSSRKEYTPEDYLQDKREERIRESESRHTEQFLEAFEAMDILENGEY